MKVTVPDSVALSIDFLAEPVVAVKHGVEQLLDESLSDFSFVSSVKGEKFVAMEPVRERDEQPSKVTCSAS